MSLAELGIVLFGALAGGTLVVIATLAWMWRKRRPHETPPFGTRRPKLEEHD